MRADANVGSNARLRVEQAVVETCRPLVGVIATVHLTSGNALVLVTIIVEDAEIHRIQECSSTYGQRWKHLSDEDQPRRIPGAINSGDKSTFSRLPLLIGSSRTGNSMAIGGIIPTEEEPLSFTEMLNLGKCRGHSLQGSI